MIPNLTLLVYIAWKLSSTWNGHHKSSSYGVSFMESV